MVNENETLRSRYSITREISRGGMGAVYLAKDLLADRDVAVKKSFFSGDAAARTGFELEAKLLARLDHPGLPKVIDYFILDNDIQVLVMDFIPGKTLEEILSSGVGRVGRGLDQRAVTKWAIEILNILQYLHSFDPPVLHRDIKPNNIKLTDDGKIVLLDFGLAKGSDVTVIHGRSGFSPIEQVERSGTDPRSDIYALGTSLFHILTDDYPLTAIDRFRLINRRTENGSSKDPVVDRQIADPQRPITDFNPEVSVEFSQIIKKAMELYPEDRFQSAEEMRRAILGYQSGLERSERVKGLTKYFADTTIDNSNPSISKGSLIGKAERLMHPKADVNGQEAEQMEIENSEPTTGGIEPIDQEKTIAGTESLSVNTPAVSPLDSVDEPSKSRPDEVGLLKETEFVSSNGQSNEVTNTLTDPSDLEIDLSGVDRSIPPARKLNDAKIKSAVILGASTLLLLSSIPIAWGLWIWSTPGRKADSVAVPQSVRVDDPIAIPSPTEDPNLVASKSEPRFSVFLKKRKEPEVLLAGETTVGVDEFFALSYVSTVRGKLLIVSRDSDNMASLSKPRAGQDPIKISPNKKSSFRGEWQIKSKQSVWLYFIILTGSGDDFQKRVRGLLNNKEVDSGSPGIPELFDELDRTAEQELNRKTDNYPDDGMIVTKVVIHAVD